MRIPILSTDIKGNVPVGIIGMVDDVAGVREYGMKAKQLNECIH